MSEKLFDVAGTSVKRGEKKLRLANGGAEARKRVLEKDGHTEVRLFDLPRKMTADEARAWVEAQGDAVPVHQPKTTVPKDRGERAARALIARADAELAHEALGREHHKTSQLSFLAWEDLSVEAQQEMCRNAAVTAGIKCPAGTYPELEAMLRKEGVKVMPDGTLA